ncbi:hypothetical protein OY671_013041, partial [Metschnikowia pulcherrima]
MPQKCSTAVPEPRVAISAISAITSTITTIDISSKTQSKMFRQTIRTAQIARTRVGLGTTMPQLRFNSTSAVAEVKDLAQFNKLIGNKEKVSIV